MTLYKVALHLCQLLALVSQSQKLFVSAHGYLTIPRARNNEDYCAHCLNAGGPQTVYADNAYTHGICGNNAADHPQNWNEADQTNIEPIGQSGDSVLLEVTVTAHHMGFFEFELCDSPDISEECFRERRLMRSNCDPEVEGELQCRRWWKPLKQEEYNHYSLTPQGYPDEAPYISGCSFVSFATYFDLPEDVDCTHCVLRWHYVTTNSCTSDDSTGEEFWNCADVSIAAPDGQTTTDTAPAEGYASMNERLTMKVPQDLTDLMVDGVDNWRCPNPAYGTPGEYFCGIDGDVSGTDGCYAAKSEETCTISFYESDIESVQEGIPAVSYCTWSGVCLENGEGGSDWCDWDESNCNSCGGQWCIGWDLLDSTEPSTTAQSTTTRQTTTFQTTTAEPTTTVHITTTKPTTTIQSTITRTTVGTTTSTHVDTVDSHKFILDAIADVSSDVTALTAIAENLQAAIDASDCATATTSDAQSSTIASTLLLDLTFSSKADFENDWTLVTDSGKWKYQDEAMMIRVGTDGSATYAYTFVSHSQAFQFFMISATGKGKVLKSGDDICRFEVSADAGTSWHNQPVLQLEASSISGSDTLVFTSGDEGLMVRWIVEGNSGTEKCYLQNVRVQGLGDMSSTTSSPLETRRLRGR